MKDEELQLTLASPLQQSVVLFAPLHSPSRGRELWPASFVFDAGARLEAALFSIRLIGPS